MTLNNYKEPRQDEILAVDIVNVRKSYYIGKMEVPVLHGIDLSVQNGEFLAIMGPSGSGKSTLMNLIGCLDRPTSGTIRLLGKEMNKLSQVELAHLRGHEIGFVFQTYNLVSRMSVFANVGLPTLANLKPGCDPRKRVKELLELVGLSDRMHHKPTELSGGQCQRVAIARALVNDPTIILADEPTGNLDTRTGGETMKIFEDLNRGGRTIIMITHDFEIASHADRIVRVKDGLLVNGNGNGNT
ncbi:MAG: putative ABC transporter ATP-binding protein [Candidatus Methanogaster sp.]|nr:MAG: putative ABC transporter ATP-binding protein [ANME-2 cluster archaeon]